MPKLKALIANLDDVEASLKEFYEKTDNGYVFSGYDDDELQDRLSKFRENNIKLQKEKDKSDDQVRKVKDQYKNINLEQYNRAMASLSKLEEKEDKDLIEKGQLDEVIKRRTAAAINAAETKTKAKDEALDKSGKENKELKNRLGSLLIDKEVQVALSNAGAKARDKALPDILGRARNTFKIDDNGSPLPQDSEGKTRYGEKGEPLTIEEFVKTDLITNAPHLFEGSSGGGAGGGDKGDGGGKGIKRISIDDARTLSKNIEGLAKGTAKIE